MPDPNYLVIGAQRCGTTWLAETLGQHPDIYVPRPKEIHFFNHSENYAKGIDWYRSRFPGYEGQRAVGEFTPNYFWVSVRMTRSACRETIEIYPRWSTPPIRRSG